MVRFGRLRQVPARHDSYPAGEAADCTPTIRQPGARAAATTHAAAAPVPLPTGTTSRSRSGAAEKTSR